MTAEEWRPALGFPGYFVSSLGRVRRTHADGVRLVSLFRDQKGYLQTSLLRDGRWVTKRIHRLVVEAFIGPIPPDLQVRHLDGQKDNLCVANLAIGTQAENNLDQVRHGTHAYARRSRCRYGHSLEDSYVRPSEGFRRCRQCESRNEAARRIRRRAQAAGSECAA